MAKQPSIGNLASGFRSSNKLNENFESIKEAFDKTLSRDGSGPNYMESELDMNSNRIINLPEPVNPNDAARLADVNPLESDVVQELLDAAAEAIAVAEEVAEGFDGKVNTSLDNLATDTLSAKETRPAAFGSAVRTPRSPEVEKTENIILYAADFGVKADNVTDDGPAWNAVIAHAKAQGLACEILTPQTGISRVSQTVLNDGHNILIRGPGAGISHDVAGAPFPFSFAPHSGFTGTLCKHASPINPSGPRIKGGGFVGVSFAGRPSRALHVQSVFGGRYDIYVGPVTGPQAVLFDCLYDYRAGAYSQLGEAGDNQGFDLKVRGRITSENGGNTNAHCVEFSGSGGTAGSLYASGNTSIVHNIDISCRTEAGHALFISNADNIGAGGARPALIQHFSTAGGRPLYVRGNRSLPAGGLGDDIHAWVTSNVASYWEGTEVAGVATPANGSITLDGSNSAPMPVFGTGVSRVAVTLLNEQYYLKLFQPLIAPDPYAMSLIEPLAHPALGLVLADGGAGALLLRLLSGGTIRIGETSDVRARFLLGDDLEGIDITGDLEVTKLKATAGGIICKPFEGSVPTLSNGELTFDVQEQTGTTSTLRFFYKKANGSNIQMGYVNLST